MRASGGAGNIEACRAQATPTVRACVMAALNAANGRANVAVAIPTEAAPKVPAGSALPAGFAAPPRTITDITAILDSEKPDLKTIEKLKAEAAANPTGKESREGLAQFYFDRGNARAQLGRLADSLADANKAIEVGRGAASPLMMGRLIALAAQQYSAAGDPKKAFELYQRQLRDVASQQGAKGYLFGANRAIAGILIQMGDIAQAEAYLRRSEPQIQEARTSGLPGKRAAYNVYGQSWEAEIELGRATLFETRGQFREAEASFKLGELRRRAAIKGLLGSEYPPSESNLVLSVDFTVLSQARVKARQGRFAEAEVDARRALLSQLKNQGKYSPVTPRFIGGLADILVEQGRYAEAEQLARVSLEISRTVGVGEDSLSNVQQLSQLGGILNLQRKGRDAIAIYAQIDKAIANWEPARRQAFELNGGGLPHSTTRGRSRLASPRPNNW
jgi:tetratricopeptide (TPR) repeat protein